MELKLPASRGAVATARHWACDQALVQGATADVIPVVELLTSELVANAVVHGGPADIAVRLTVVRGVVTVAVSDGSDALPVTRTTGPDVPGGHGLRLVEKLALQWGVDGHRSGGKTVWFDVGGSADRL